MSWPVAVPGGATAVPQAPSKHVRHLHAVSTPGHCVESWHPALLELLPSWDEDAPFEEDGPGPLDPEDEVTALLVASEDELATSADELLTSADELVTSADELDTSPEDGWTPLLDIVPCDVAPLPDDAIPEVALEDVCCPPLELL